MPNNSEYLQRNNFLYFSWEQLTSNWGKKLLIFGRGNHLILAVFRPLKNLITGLSKNTTA